MRREALSPAAATYRSYLASFTCRIQHVRRGSRGTRDTGNSRAPGALRPSAQDGMALSLATLPHARELGASLVAETSYVSKIDISMSSQSEPGDERLVRSTERVRDIGEVFTPRSTVDAMLDMLPGLTWAVHPSHTFLEPACGNGNFLVAILERKLNRVSDGYVQGMLPAGAGIDSAQFHGLEALASIYGVDISTDNVIGGTPGHEGARARMLNLFSSWHADSLRKRLGRRGLIYRAAHWIVSHNILVANMLPWESSGSRTGRDSVPLVEYRWDAASRKVTLRRTTLGDVTYIATTSVPPMVSLLPRPEPQFIWSGRAVKLSAASRIETPRLSGPARNGARRRRR